MIALTMEPTHARQVLRNGSLTNARMIIGLIPCLGSLDLDKCAYAIQKFTVLHLSFCLFLQII